MVLSKTEEAPDLSKISQADMESMFSGEKDADSQTDSSLEQKKPSLKDIKPSPEVNGINNQTADRVSKSLEKAVPKSPENLAKPKNKPENLSKLPGEAPKPKPKASKPSTPSPVVAPKPSGESQRNPKNPESIIGLPFKWAWNKLKDGGKWAWDKITYPIRWIKNKL